MANELFNRAAHNIARTVLWLAVIGMGLNGCAVAPNAPTIVSPYSRIIDEGALREGAPIRKSEAASAKMELVLSDNTRRAIEYNEVHGKSSANWNPILREDLKTQIRDDHDLRPTVNAIVLVLRKYFSDVILQQNIDALKKRDVSYACILDMRFVDTDWTHWTAEANIGLTCIDANLATVLALEGKGHAPTSDDNKANTRAREAAVADLDSRLNDHMAQATPFQSQGQSQSHADSLFQGALVNDSTSLQRQTDNLRSQSREHDVDTANADRSSAAVVGALQQTAQVNAGVRAQQQSQKADDEARARVQAQLAAEQQQLAMLNARVTQNQQQTAQNQQFQPQQTPGQPTQTYQQPIHTQAAAQPASPLNGRAHFTYKDTYESDGSGGLIYKVYVTNDGNVKLRCHGTAKGLVWEMHANGNVQSEYSTSGAQTIYPGHTDSVAGFDHAVGVGGSYTVGCDPAN
jgi:type II secretory pathway pseudopilin PulG